MVKSYLSYKNEVNFGTVNSQSCKSIQFLTYNYILTGTDDSVSVWDVKVDEIKIKFEFTKNEFYFPSLVQSFILSNCNDIDKLNRGNGYGVGLSQRKFSKDEQLFVGYADGTIRRFRLSSETINSLLSPTEAREELNFLSSGQVGSNFELKRTNFGFFVISEEATLLGHKSSVTHLTLSVNEKLLISGGKDHRVLVWRALDGQLLCQLEGHTEEILTLSYHISSPNSGNNELDDLGFVVSGAKDNSIRFWAIWSVSCVDTLVEPLFQLSGFSIFKDKLFVWFKNNDSMKCYDISQIGQIKLLFTLSPKESNLKCQNILFTRCNGELVGDKEEFIVVYSKHVYFYELLDEEGRERKRLKRERRVSEKLRSKVKKLKRLVGEANIPFNAQFFKSLTDLKEKYKYLKNILNPFNPNSELSYINQPSLNSNSQLMDDNQLFNEDRDNELLEVDNELLNIDKQLVDGDYYELSHVHSLSEGVSNCALFNDYLALGYSTNAIDIFKLFYSYSSGNIDSTNQQLINDTDVLELKEDGNNGINNDKQDKLVWKCCLGKFHRDPVRTAVLSPNNKVLVTLSNSSLFTFNTLSNNLICSFTDYLTFNQLDNSNEIHNWNEPQNPKNIFKDVRVKISEIVTLAFINQTNLMILSRRNTLCVLSLSSNSLVFELELHSLEEELVNFHLMNPGNFGGLADSTVGDDNSDSAVNGQSLLVLLVYRRGLIRVLRLAKEEDFVGELKISGEIVSSKVMNENIYLNLSNNSIVIVKWNCAKIKGDFSSANKTVGNILQVKLTLFGHKLPVVDLSPSDDNLLLVSGSKDKTVKIWDVRFGNILKTLIQNAVVSQVQFLKNTHYVLIVDLRNCVKLFDCDLLAPITEISTFFRRFNCFVISNYNQFIYLIGNEFTVCKFAVDPSELVFPEEEAERLEDAKTFKSGQLIAKLENIITMLEQLSEEVDWNGLKLLNEAIEGVNLSLAHELIIALPFINTQQLLKSIIGIFQLVHQKGCIRLLNLEKLIYVSLGISEVYLRQFVADKSLMYDLRRFTRLFLNDYLELVYFNKSGLEYVKNAIVRDERVNLKRLM